MSIKSGMPSNNLIIYIYIYIPNCVAQLQKQFSSFASEIHEAALERGWAGVQCFWHCVTLIRCSTGRTTLIRVAWQKQSWTAASEEPWGAEGMVGAGGVLAWEGLRLQTT